LLDPVGAACGPTCPSDAQPTNGTWLATAEVADCVCEKIPGPAQNPNQTATPASKRQCFFMRRIISTARRARFLFFSISHSTPWLG